MDKDERKRQLYERYDRHALDTGVRLQGEHFLRSVHMWDEADPEWTEEWLSWIYGHLYGRQRLDDKTRVLIIIGELTVLGDFTHNLANHMRTALEVGASPDEILEVILQAPIYGGMPRAFRALDVYRRLMVDLGYREYTDPPFEGTARDPR